jgi:hypothetical protein
MRKLNKWQQQEYHRKAQEIRDKGLGMTYADEQQMIAYERAALNCMLDRALGGFVERLAAEAEAKVEGWTSKRIQLVEQAARKGHPAAQRLLASLQSRDSKQDSVGA